MINPQNIINKCIGKNRIKTAQNFLDDAGDVFGMADKKGRLEAIEQRRQEYKQWEKDIKEKRTITIKGKKVRML